MAMMNEEAHKRIRDYLEGFLQGLINKYDPEIVKAEVLKKALTDPRKGNYMPFHAALIPDDLMRLQKFFRSFATSLGQGVFENIAKIIAEYNPKWKRQAIATNKKIEIPTSSEIQAIIASFIEKVKERKLLPYPPPEFPKLQTGQSMKITSDLYLENQQGLIYFFEIKSPKPNKDVCSQSKEKFLYFKAAFGEKGVYRFAFPYNPWGEVKIDYKWSFTLSLFDISNECLIGKEFWDFIGGEGSYEAILGIFKDVGTNWSDKMLRRLLS